LVQTGQCPDGDRSGHSWRILGIDRSRTWSNKHRERAKHKKQKWPPGEISVPHSPDRLHSNPGFSEIQSATARRGWQFSDTQSIHGDSSALADVMRDNAPDSGRDGQPTGNAVMPPLDTHWSRIFYYDLFTTYCGGSTPDPSGTTKGDLMSPAFDFRTRPSCGENKEMFVATKDSSRDAGSHRLGSPIQAAPILLAVVIAMYLAVAGVVHVLVSRDAAAVVPDSSPTPASAATASDPPVSAGQSSSDSVDQDSERTDNSRECRPSAAIDSKCIFN
jgi:hypothetical protein